MSTADLPLPATHASDARVEPFWRLLIYVAAGAGFGWLLVRAEIISWFRIQEMFRFQAFHMFGIIGSAVVTATVCVALLRRFGVRTLDQQPIRLPDKTLGSGIRYVCGGLLFGIGWAFTGACPGPLFALVGTGSTVVFVPIASAILGTYVYGLLRPRLPH